MREHDVRWQDGRTFGMVYDAGPEAHELLEAVAPMFLHDNALNTKAFPSLARIQSEVVGITADLLHGPEASGFMTSGGTESILLAVKAARERCREERGITAPEMVLPISAHAAFHKAAHYFGLTVRRVPVDADWKANVDAAADLVNENTVLVVGSAPQYPQGVVDPIPELAALAVEVGANFHTDACMGGFVLPFMDDGVIGHVSALHYSAALDTPKNQEFVKKYRAKYGKVPSYYSENNYTTGLMIDTVMKAAGGKFPGPEGFVKSLSGMKFDAVRGPVAFDELRNPIQNIYIKKVEKKKMFGYDKDELWNTVIKTYPNVSQFWTYGKEKVLGQPVYSRDFQ